jgi:FkbM family methyltransferase
VLAFEPQRLLHQLLCGNVSLNMHSNVVAIHAALGSETGTIRVPRTDYANIGNFGGIALGDHQDGETVPVERLDSYNLKSCDLIKIDVEGMEQSVLQGARMILEKYQPLLYVENDRAEKSRDLIQWLMTNGYRLYWHLPRMFNPKNYFAEAMNVFGNTVSINMLCVPRSKTISPKGLQEIASPDDSWRHLRAQRNE